MQIPESDSEPEHVTQFELRIELVNFPNFGSLRSAEMFTATLLMSPEFAAHSPEPQSCSVPLGIVAKTDYMYEDSPAYKVWEELMKGLFERCVDQLIREAGGVMTHDFGGVYSADAPGGAGGPPERN